MAIDGEAVRPGDAARAVGIKPSTLRVYVQRFSELLSDDAASSERPGYRFYNARDVDLLRRARELLGRGFTYERVLVELRGSASSDRGDARRPRGRRGEADFAPVAAQLQVMEQAVAAWRDLAEERAVEIASLRDEVRRLQQMVLTARHAAPLTRLRQRT